MSAKGRSWKRTPPPETTPSTEQWVELARDALIDGGILAVKIDRLAKIAGVTRGGFYWRFKSHSHLLKALLDDWCERNTAPILAALSKPGRLDERIRRLGELYILEIGFSPAYDRAVRAWANLDPDIEQVVRRTDELRIGAIFQAFRDEGYESREALIRARIVYFQQVGYYAIGMHETVEDRQEFAADYVRVFVGRT